MRKGLVLRGIVEKILPGGKYRIALKNGNVLTENKINCYLSGRLSLNKFKVIEGDEVEVEASLYDLKSGRILSVIKNSSYLENDAREP